MTRHKLTAGTAFQDFYLARVMDALEETGGTQQQLERLEKGLGQCSADQINARNTVGWTAAHAMAQLGLARDLFAFAHAKGLEFDRVDDRKAPPLFYLLACREKVEQQTIAWFAETVAETLGLQDIQGLSGFHYAVLSDDPDRVAQLGHDCARRGWRNVINYVNCSGWSPLHFACAAQELEQAGRIIDILLDFQCDASLRTNRGVSAFQLHEANDKRKCISDSSRDILWNMHRTRATDILKRRKEGQ